MFQARSALFEQCRRRGPGVELHLCAVAQSYRRHRRRGGNGVAPGRAVGGSSSPLVTLIEGRDDHPTSIAASVERLLQAHALDDAARRPRCVLGARASSPFRRASALREYDPETRSISHRGSIRVLKKDTKDANATLALVALALSGP